MDLKQFIDANRSAFDCEEPGSYLLQKIQGHLPETPNRKKPNWLRYRWAAAIAGLLLVGSAAYLFFTKGADKNNSPVNEPIANEELINEFGDPVYAKQIVHFREIIGLQQNELKQLQKEYPQLYQQFVVDMNELDSAYQSLKINLAENPNREMLLEAMIQNLQLQSDLLNRQLLIIKEIKQKSNSHEKIVI